MRNAPGDAASQRFSFAKFAANEMPATDQTTRLDGAEGSGTRRDRRSGLNAVSAGGNANAVSDSVVPALSRDPYVRVGARS